MEKPQKLPAYSFSTPFSKPDLQWSRKKRLRCFKVDPSRPIPADSKTSTPLTCPSPSSPLPATPLLSDPPRLLIRLRIPTREEEKRPLVGEKPSDQVTNCDGAGMVLRSRSRNGGEKGKKKAELRVSLTREEIEEDFFAMTGSKPPPIPKNRSRVQSHLKEIFPGSSLPSKITPQMY